MRDVRALLLDGRLMPVIAIDPSLTRSGVVYRSLAGREVITSITPHKSLSGCKRLQFIRDTFMEIVYEHEPELVVMENYSMGSRGRTFHIGELGGVLKLALYEYNTPILLVPPSNLKQFAIGKGNADKQDIRMVVEREWGAAVKNLDESDAYVLYRMGLAQLKHYTLRKTFRKVALTGCELI
jgi:crossover junction endodeoxyribonuclease RuvC